MLLAEAFANLNVAPEPVVGHFPSLPAKVATPLLAYFPLPACPLNHASDEDAHFLPFGYHRCPHRGQSVDGLPDSFPRVGHHRNAPVCSRKPSASPLPDRNVQTECSHEMGFRCAFNAESPKNIAAVRTRALPPNFLDSFP
jgi:hypothetical protein